MAECEYRIYAVCGRERFGAAVPDMRYAVVSELIQEEREIVFVWVPGNVGIRGNSAADSAAKDALGGDILDKFIPFSDPKPRLNNYIFELWQ